MAGFWSQDELLKVKASLPGMKWNAQWMQQPTAEEGSIIKREWWQRWENDSLPGVKYIMQSYDTRFLKSKPRTILRSQQGVLSQRKAHPTVLFYWIRKKVAGTFQNLKKSHARIPILQSDMVLIEAKASGTPLTHELRRMGIPVVNYSPTRGHDKHSRMHSVAPIFEAGMVWAPNRMFAEDMIEECAAFPFGANDDLCDTMTQALMRFREGGFVYLDSDYDDEEREPRKRVYY